MFMNAEFIAMLDYLERERGIKREILLEAVSNALLSASKKSVSASRELRIDINPKTCIGCGDCATQCPYDAISMIARPQPNNGSGGGLFPTVLSAFSLGEPDLPKTVEQTENLLAVKCNLCHETGLNPKGAKTEAYSCEENCPTVILSV